MANDSIRSGEQHHAREAEIFLSQNIRVISSCFDGTHSLLTDMDKTHSCDSIVKEVLMSLANVVMPEDSERSTCRQEKELSSASILHPPLELTILYAI